MANIISLSRPAGSSRLLLTIKCCPTRTSTCPHGPPYIALRGISRYRYQGDDVSTVQTQLAWQATPRWVVQGFVGAGSAADSAGDLYDTTEIAWGTGFRYLIAREYGLHTGVDVAFSDREQAVYFNVGSGL